jgi:hypothetical protein
MRKLVCDGCRKTAEVTPRASARVEIVDPAASRDSRAFAWLYTENGWVVSANGDPADGTALCFACRTAAKYEALEVCRECDALLPCYELYPSTDGDADSLRDAGFCSEDCRAVHGGGVCPECGEAMDAHDMRAINAQGGVGVCPPPACESCGEAHYEAHQCPPVPGVRAVPMSGGYYAVTRDGETIAAWYTPEKAWWLVAQIEMTKGAR